LSTLLDRPYGQPLHFADRTALAVGHDADIDFTPVHLGRDEDGV